MKDVDELNKEGVFTGSYAVNPATNEKVPVYAGNFVVADYGSGMVMAVPAHDQRDFEFAKKYGIGIKQVIEQTRNRIITLTSSLKNEFYEEAKKFGEVVHTNDGLTSIYTDKIDEVFEIAQKYFKNSPCYIHSEGKIKKILIYLRENSKVFLWSNEKQNIEAKKLALKFGIKEEQLDYDSFYRAYTDSGKLVNSSEFNGLDNETAKEQITNWLEKKKKARKVVNFRLRDWLISRQRYLGTPIPIIYCDKCGAVPVAEKDLPVKLPKDVKFGKGNPLLTNDKWINAKCPSCGGKGKRETDTMDTFVNSSWYYLRYADSKNNEKIFDSKKANYWCPIDQYIGGAEHATMHLIYVRFYTKFLADLGLINFREPAKKLFHQGMLAGEGGVKMSKSKGNVINPDAVSEKYGIDTARYFLLSLASPDKPRDWSEKGIQGSLRFIKRIFDVFENVKIGKDSEDIEILINKAVKDIEAMYGSFDYRTATIRLKELFENFAEQKEISKKTLEKALIILHPICPHITEELWEKIGNKGFVSLEKWPEYKEIREKKEKKDINQNIINYVSEVIKKVEGKQKIEKVFIYVMPFEIKDIDANKISKALGKETKIFAVNDPEKYDPENKAKKALPGKPGVYLE
jgi:leucyl-tRNA synthetase